MRLNLLIAIALALGLIGVIVNVGGCIEKNRVPDAAHQVEAVVVEIGAPKTPVHVHEWGAWEKPLQPYNKGEPSGSYVQFSVCKTCGIARQRYIWGGEDPK